MTQQQLIKEALIKTPQNYFGQSIGQKRNEKNGPIQDGSSYGGNGSDLSLSQGCFLYEIMEMMSQFQFDVMKLQIALQQSLAKQSPNFVKADLEAADTGAEAAFNQYKDDAKTSLIQGVMGVVGTVSSVGALGHEGYKSSKVGGDTNKFKTQLDEPFQGDIEHTSRLNPNASGVKGTSNSPLTGEEAQKLETQIIEKANEKGIQTQDIENRIKDFVNGDSQKIESFASGKDSELNKLAVELAKARRTQEGNCDFDKISRNVNDKLSEIVKEKEKLANRSQSIINVVSQATNAVSSIAKSSYDTDKAKQAEDAQKLNARLDVIKQELQQIQSFINSEQQDANQSLQSAGSYAQAFGQIVNVHG